MAGPLAPPQSDRDLLGRFARDRDEAAFAALVRRAGRLPPGPEAADYDEGESGETAARATAGGILGCFGGCAGVLLAIPLWASPGLAAILVAVEQHERAQERAITQVYGEAAYAAGVRITRNDMLNTGVPAHPDAVRIYRHRSFLPHFTAFLLTLLAADWMLRRHLGEGYNGKKPLIDLGHFRRPVPPPRRAWPAE